MDVELQKCLRNSEKFSQIYQFINNFGPFIQISWTFEQLEQMLAADVNSQQSDELVTAMLILIRKVNPSYRPLCGRAGLDKFISEYYGIENLNNCEDYQSFDIQTKMDFLLEVLYLSCRTHFGIIAGFKQRKIPPHELRWKPVGTDYDGLEYYYQEDSEFNPRVYVSGSDGDWTLKTRTRQGIYKLIKSLQGEEVSEELKNLVPEIVLSKREKKRYRLWDRQFSYGNFFKQINVTVTSRSVMRFTPKEANSEEKENANEKKEKKREPEASRMTMKPGKKSTTPLEKEANFMSSWLKKTPKESKYICKKCNVKGLVKEMNACKVCDKFYHIECVRTKTKEKLWTCPICTNKVLVGRLSMIYNRLGGVIQQKMEEAYIERKIEVKSKYSLRKYEHLNKLEKELCGERSDVSEDDEDDDYKEDECEEESLDEEEEMDEEEEEEVNEDEEEEDE